MRTGLAARTISALARGSTSTVNAPPAPPPGGAAPATAPSPRRWMIAAMSLATPCTMRDDFDVGGARGVERGDDLADALQVVGVVGDDQRVVARVGVDRVVGADQGPQHRHQVVRVLVVELEDLRQHLVAARARAGRLDTVPACSLASASGTTLSKPAMSTSVNPSPRRAAR